MRKSSSEYDWNHKFRNKLERICVFNLVAIKIPEEKEKRLEYIRNASPGIVEFLDSAIRCDYNLPMGWTKNKLTDAYKDAKNLNWENLNEIKNYIKNYIRD